MRAIKRRYKVYNVDWFTKGGFNYRTTTNCSWEDVKDCRKGARLMGINTISAVAFTQSVMNGTETMETSVSVYATRELAEQTLADIKADNAKRDLGGYRVRYSKVQETTVYETKDEIPFYQFKG